MSKYAKSGDKMSIQDLWKDPKNQRNLALGIAAIVVIGGGYKLYTNLTNKTETAKIVPLVRTYTVGELQNAQATATYPGEVRGRYESKLAFQVGGRIISRLVNVGDTVTTGQVLMALDPKDVNQNVEAASAALASAIANQKLAADNARRYNTLFAQGAVSESVRDTYNTQLEAANATLRQAQAQSNSASNQLGYTQLTSDADGVVASISGEVGQVAAAGTTMATIVRSGEREIQINVPEGINLVVGQNADVTFWALPNTSVQGTVREISPMADQTTRTYKVCIAVPNLPAAAKLGMTAKVSLTPQTDAAVQNDRGFIIPATTLYQINNKPQVWLVRDGKAVLSDITIAGYQGNNIVVSSGIQKGDAVITAGLSKLTPDLEVRTDEGGESK